ncbi:MAG: Ig-like domain-containing protein [Telluria sp.]
MPSTIRSLFVRIGLLLLFLFGSAALQNASAQAVFSGVSITPTSGTVDSSGKLTIRATGNTQNKLSGDAVSEVDLMEGETVLSYQTYPISYNTSGVPVNTVRSINLSAGLSPGTHTVNLRAYTDGGFSTNSTQTTITVSAPVVAANGAAFVSQSVPFSMTPGGTYSVSVTMQNTGTTTWTPGSYGLGAANPNDNYNWGSFNRVYVTSNVPPNSSYTFSFTVKAPSSGSSANFQWRMVQEYVEWFGSYTPNVAVQLPIPQPTATFTSPANGATYNASGSTATVSFSGTAAPGSGASLSSVQLSEAGSVFASGTSSSISGSKALTIGSHTIQLSVTDSRGQTATATRSVTVVPAAPTASFSSPSNGASFSATGSTASVAISATGSPGYGASVSQMRLYVDGTWTTYTGSSLSTTLTLAAGSHTLGVAAVDNYGTVGSTSFITVTVVAPTPTASLTSPANYSYFVTTGTTSAVPVVGTATAVGGSAITKLELLDQGTVIDTQLNVSSYSKTLNLAVGLHSLMLRATNAAGVAGTSPSVVFQVQAAKPGDSAQFISQSVPAAMRAGQPYTVSVTMLNNGTTTWTDAANYRLGAQNPQDNRNFGWRAYLSSGSSVAMGQTAVFTFQVTAPAASPTSYNFQWQMLREYVAWFGDLTTNQAITVTQGAGPTAVLSATPTNVRVSGAQTQTVQFTGSGTRSGGTVTKLELFQDSGRGYGTTPVNTVTGSASSMNYSYSLSLGAGTYAFKLRATDSAGVQTDSARVMVNVTNSGLLGTVSGVRSNAAGNPELYGWVCQAGNASGLTYKVLLDAPTLDAGATLLTTGVANVNTELDAASVQSQCGTPGAGHHFVVDLSTYVATYAGRALYVFAQTADASTTVSLPCADNNCTMPNTLRVGITTPTNGSRVNLPNPVFMQMQLTNASGTYDETGFMVDGTWYVATAEGTTGRYSVSVPLAARSAPYTLYAKVRQGNMTLQSVASQVTVVDTSATISMSSPSDGATVSQSAQTLTATATGTVASVKFFVNGSPLAGSSGSGTSWTQSWTPASAGTYSIYVLAYDAWGTQIAESAPVSVTVNASASGATPVPVVVSVPHLTDPDAGKLPGELVVTAQGAAAYTIPVVVPPGTAGLQPALTLGYNSSGTNGLLGLGWKLGGLSSIHRCGKTIAQDSSNARISFTASDRLCLDGQRLVLVNNTLSDANYWADGAEYRTEVDTFVRVKAIGPLSARTFTVEGKDGRISHYGSGTAAVAAIVAPYNGGATPPSGPARDGGAQSWAIDSIRDRVDSVSGNFVTFEYYQDPSTGEHRPVTIRYGGKGLNPHAAVAFVYESRPDAWKRYIDETRNDLRSRISKIRTYVGEDLSGAPGSVGSTLVREYTLSYEQSPTSGRSLLNSVQGCARNGTVATMECQPATVFSWGKPDKQPGFVDRGAWSGTPLLTKNSASNGEVHAEYFAFADFENHGRTDVLEKRVAPPTNAPNSGLPVTTVDGLAVGTKQTQYRYFHNNGAGFTQYTYQLDTGEAFAVLDVADFDGDGAPDIVAATASGSKVCLSPFGAGFPVTVAGPLVFTCSSSYSISTNVGNSADHPAYLVDVVGDGRSGQYSRIEKTGAATLCLQTNCVSDNDPPAVLVPNYNTDGTPQYALANYVAFTQMVDFTGIGKPYDVRFSRPYYMEYRYDVDGTKIYSNSWVNLRPTISITGFNRPGDPANGVMAPYTYSTQYTSPPANVAQPPYMFDEPYPGAALAADFSGSGYSSLAFGFVELGYDAVGPVYNRSDMTICVSTGRGLDCGVRQKYSGANYRAMVNVADFVGDGAPAILAQTVTFDAAKHATKTGQLEMCRVTGDDTTNGSGTSDANMACEAWPGVTLNMGGTDRNNDRVYFMDLLGTGRMQLVYYHGGYTGTDNVWHEDGRWSVYEPIDRAAPGQALDRIYSVTNGVGTVSSVEYADGLGHAANDAIVTRTGDTDLVGAYAQHIALRTGKFVQRLHVGDGEGRQRTSSYSYADPAVDVAGRGALGFGTVTETDDDSGLVTTTRYSHRWPFNDMARSVQKRAGQTLLANLANTLSVKTLAHSPGSDSSFPYVSQSTLDRWDLGGSAYPLGTVTTVNHYDDAYGNLTAQEVTSSAAGKVFVAKTVTSYVNDATSIGNWLVGLPEFVTVTKTDPDFVGTDQTHDVSRHVHNTYDPTTGLLSYTITEEGSQLYSVKTDFTRSGNSFGLVSERKETWYDLQAAVNKTRSQTFVYDSKGRFPQTVTNAAGHTEFHTYDPTNGVRTALKDANSLTTSWTLNGFGRVTVETRPGFNEIRSYLKQCVGACRRGAALVQITEQFNGSSRIAVPTLTYTDDVGHTVSKETFDFAGQPVFADQFNDAFGRPQRVDQPAYEGASSTMAWRQEYDILDRVTKRVTLDEGGAEQATTIDYQGLLRVLTDPLNHKRTEACDALGQLVSVTDGKNGVTTLAYEPFGNLRKAIDPSGNVSEIFYDVLGHKTKLTDPDLGQITYTPDQFGRVLVQQTAEQAYRGDRTDMTYDALDRMTSRYEHDLKAGWVYDTSANGKGQLAEAHTGSAAPWDYRRVHSYNSQGRPSTVTTTLTDAAYTSTPEYDAWGRVITLTHQRGSDPAKAFGLRYNAFGYLATVERGSLVLWRATLQDAAGRVRTAVLGNTLTQTWTYSPYSGRLTGAQLSTGANVLRLDEGYQYDPIGNVSTRSQQWNGHGFIEMFTYDELNRLKTSMIGANTKTVDYYPDGRIKNKSGVGSGDYVYPTVGTPGVPARAVSSIPGMGDFHYDRNGNLLDGASRTATWTSFDMPATITKGTNRSTFIYGPEYQRVRQDRGDQSSVIYAGAQEVESAGGQVTVKTYWPNGIGVEIDRPGKATELSWTHLDRLGSPVALTDEAGIVREELAYDAWGKRRNTLDNTMDDTVDGKTDNKGFTNHEMLDQLDLVHMNGRVYDPLISLFMSGDFLVQDPTNGQNHNRYSYVLNNPTNLTDPTGFACEAGGAAGPDCGKGFSLLPFEKCDGCSVSIDSESQQGGGKQNPAGTEQVDAKRNRADSTSSNSGSNKGRTTDGSCTTGSSSNTCSTEHNEFVQDGVQTIVAKPKGLVRLKSFTVTAADRQVAWMLGIAANGIPFERGVVWAWDGYKVWRAAQAAKAANEISAAERAKQLHSVLDPRAQRARTTAVTDTEEGIRVVSSSERRLTPAQRKALSKNEVEGIGEGHAEVTGVNAARQMGLTPTGTAASRPICSGCASHLENAGVDPLSPLK